MKKRRWMENPHDLHEVFEFFHHEASNLKNAVTCVMDNLDSERNNFERAKETAALLDRRLDVLISALKAQRADLEQEEVLSVPEEDLFLAEKYFLERGTRMGVFTLLDNLCLKPSQDRAIRTALLWKAFTKIMPEFLISGAAKLPTNEMRFPLIHGAWEELGSGIFSKIHTRLFDEIASIVGLDDSAEASDTSVDEILMKMKSAKSPSYILGLVLGIEIPGVHIIETLYRALAWNSKLETELARHPFFRIHRKIEQGHIRRAVANYLRFCTDEGDRQEFNQGVDEALEFWITFWNRTRESSAAIPLKREDVCLTEAIS